MKGKHALKDFPHEFLTGQQVYSEWLDDVSPPKTSMCGGNGHKKGCTAMGRTITETRKTYFENCHTGKT